MILCSRASRNWFEMFLRWRNMIILRHIMKIFSAIQGERIIKHMSDQHNMFDLGRPFINSQSEKEKRNVEISMLYMTVQFRW